MTRHYKWALSVEYPNLLFEVSDGLKWLVQSYKIPHTNAELVFMRRKVLENLRNMGITQKNYNAEYFFTKVDAEFIALNNMYNTRHSFADIKQKE